MKRRTIYDPNEIVIHDDYAEVVLYNKNCVEIDKVLIDLEDIEKVSKHKWHKSYSGYAVTSNSKPMHRLIIKCPKEKFIDHINHNKLDNRKQNLRICNKQQNAFNMKIPNTNRSGIKGVGFHKHTNKWRARIVVNDKEIYLGIFNTIEEATKARKEAELKYFGEYRNKD